MEAIDIVDNIIKEVDKWNCECDPSVGMAPCFPCDLFYDLVAIRKVISCLVYRNPSAAEITRLKKQNEQYERALTSLYFWGTLKDSVRLSEKEMLEHVSKLAKGE